MAGPVRQAIDADSLSRYLEKNVPVIKLPVDIKQFGFGQSNPTYQLTAADGARYVLRKKPPGKLLSKTAHQVEREYRIIHALEKTDVPVPKAHALCEDKRVIGTAFYIMEFLDGRIVEDASLPEVSAEERKEMWHDAIRTLAKLHRVHPQSVGLSDFGKPSGFYNRQIRTLGTISLAQAQAVDVKTEKPVGDIPHFSQMVAFFADSTMQPQDRSTLIHGDYKIDNLVYHKTEPRVIGILDWEMSTIGHPLSDVSNLTSPFIFAENADFRTKFVGATTLNHFAPESRRDGLPSYEQALSWYAEVAGWNPRPDGRWGAAFGVFRNSVIMQGIAARYALRQASSAKAKEHGDKMDPFGEFAFLLAEQARRGRKVGGVKL